MLATVTLSTTEIIVCAAIVLLGLVSVMHAIRRSLRRERWVMHQMIVSILIVVVAGLLIANS